ncbi:MAG: RNA polymerase sigma factor [Candidatus Auribacterota bacterium]|jgi:RNA polymerase sigma-70 factor (ECF subfamily)|uniref:RNA polymerase sigma factor n=1 Tax=Candidatus Auribacter fodinae TaxID=2093366 RepID=A0A3A4R683_9BACT|nr:MAG: RNA polymerase sigma factor [Candidatus Auribacter fodinae]
MSINPNGKKYLEYSDEELILSARDDAHAFDAFHQRFLSKILNYVNRLVGDYQKAEEITQETFLQVYRHLDTYRPEGKTSSWLFKIATNLSKNELRNQRRRNFLGFSLNNKISNDEQDTELLELIPDRSHKPDTLAEINELADTLEKAINKLPLKYREVILICEVYGYSYQEASEILNCTKANVGIRLCRARRQIKKIIESMSPHASLRLKR